MRKMKWFSLVAVLYLVNAVYPAFSQSDVRFSAHPRIVTVPERKKETLQQIAQQPWAKQVLDNLKNSVDPYVDEAADYKKLRKSLLRGSSSVIVEERKLLFQP